MRIKANEPPREPEERTDILEETPNEEVEEVSPASSQKRWNTTKIVVWICLLNGFAWVWCSYILAWLGKEQIAESLSQVAVTEIIGVVLAYCLKAAIENLSKNNNWPDKSDKDPPAG